MKRIEIWRKYSQKMYKTGSTALTLQIEPNSNFKHEGCIGVAETLVQLGGILTNFTFEVGERNDIEEEGYQILGEAIAQLTMLERLSLRFTDGNYYTTTDRAKRLCQSTLRRENLKQLSLYFGDQIIGIPESMVSLAKSLKTSPNLTSLHLTFDIDTGKFNNEGATQLSEAISNMKNLKQLSIISIYATKVNAKGIQNLAKRISNLKNISDLTFEIEASVNEDQKILIGSNQMVSEMIGSLKNLENLTLKLPQNGIKIQDAAILAKNLQIPERITTFRLKLNQVYVNANPTQANLISGISQMKQLKHLSFDFERINNVNRAQIPKLKRKIIKECKKLVILSI